MCSNHQYSERFIQINSADCEKKNLDRKLKDFDFPRSPEKVFGGKAYLCHIYQMS